MRGGEGRERQRKKDISVPNNNPRDAPHQLRSRSDHARALTNSQRHQRRSRHYHHPHQPSPLTHSHSHSHSHPQRQAPQTTPKHACRSRPPVPHIPHAHTPITACRRENVLAHTHKARDAVVGACDAATRRQRGWREEAQRVVGTDGSEDVGAGGCERVDVGASGGPEGG